MVSNVLCLLAHFKFNFTLICNSYLRPYKYLLFLFSAPPPLGIVQCSCCSVCVFRVVSFVQCFVLYCSVPYTFCSCKILLYFCSSTCKLYLCCKSKDILFIRKINFSFPNFLIWGIHTLQACVFSGFLHFQVHNLFSMTDIMFFCFVKYI